MRRGEAFVLPSREGEAWGKVVLVRPSFFQFTCLGCVFWMSAGREGSPIFVSFVLIGGGGQFGGSVV